MTYYIDRAFTEPFEEVLLHMKQALADEGFGVLTEIDVQETMKQKLGVSVDRYHILGACNPPFAHAALQADPHIGLLLPCNVIVYETDGKVMASAMRPTALMGASVHPKMQDIAQQVEEKIERVMAA